MVVDDGACTAFRGASDLIACNGAATKSSALPLAMAISTARESAAKYWPSTYALDPILLTLILRLNIFLSSETGVL
jgi:hypothetical protein